MIRQRVYPLGAEMKKWIIGIVTILGMAACHSQESKPFPNASSIKRLDGSAITASEIDVRGTYRFE